MKVSFQAIPSGDCECFCFAVDLATFVGIMHEEPDQYHKNRFHEGLFNIYPGQFFEGDRKLNITIEIEE